MVLFDTISLFLFFPFLNVCLVHFSGYELEQASFDSGDDWQRSSWMEGEQYIL